MPDGMFPNINLVEGLLNCIDALRIDIGHLEDSELAKSVQYYSEGIANIPQVIPLAKKIIEKWSRLIYHIKSSFDEGGAEDFDHEYRNFQKRLQKIRNRGGEEKTRTSDVDDNEEESSSEEV